MLALRQGIIWQSPRSLASWETARVCLLLTNMPAGLRLLQIFQPNRFLLLLITHLIKLKGSDHLPTLRINQEHIFTAAREIMLHCSFAPGIQAVCTIHIDFLDVDEITKLASFKVVEAFVRVLPLKPQPLYGRGHWFVELK